MTHTSLGENIFSSGGVNMQRDLKVGLSLGVLVLGVVGALLFRRDQVAESPKPALKTARKIDERIADRPRTPYMVGDIEFDQDAGSTGKNPKEELAGSDRPAHTVPPNWLEDEEDPFQVARTPESNAGQQTVDNQAIPAAPRTVTPYLPTETAQAAALQTHVIQSGESLSTIAERYLGSQGRFQELYDANRDVLTDPNRLPLGTTIVIPAKNKVAAKGSAALSQAHSPATSKSLAAHSEKVRSTITDVSAIEPIAPPNEEPLIDREEEAVNDTVKRDAEPSKPVEQATGVTPTVPTQTREARKLFAPSRLPFSNSRSQPATRSRKPLDPEGEDFQVPTVTPVKGIAPAVPGEPRMYQVRKGDSLEKISLKVYGNGRRATEIFDANRSLLARPDALREGQELILPD